ncbi:MAG: ATP-binding cassette domain-containing protein, partial [Candidatus Aenigmarchaeota archaeon]|nr:ATP-binding cassette domain-containing protein [Candidatus Aenigmarchaeota archaeon]
FPLKLLKTSKEEREKRAKEVAKLVQIEELLDRKPAELSGGQQQRVAIARCLVADPEIILADEPTGALDSVTGKEVLDMLEKIWKEEGKTVIMVTHDLHLAEYAHDIIELKDGKVVRMEKNNKQK